MAQRLKTDWILFSTVLAMVFSGVVIFDSASAIMPQMGPNRSAWHFVERQAAWAVIALVIMMALKSTHYRKLQNPAVALSAIRDRKSTRLNSSHLGISYAVFCLKKKMFQTSCLLQTPISEEHTSDFQHPRHL